MRNIVSRVALGSKKRAHARANSVHLRRKGGCFEAKCLHGLTTGGAAGVNVPRFHGGVVRGVANGETCPWGMCDLHRLSSMYIRGSGGVELSR